jgi:hypothetical protein
MTIQQNRLRSAPNDMAVAVDRAQRFLINIMTVADAPKTPSRAHVPFQLVFISRNIVISRPRLYSAA